MRVSQVLDDPSPWRLVYDPGHPLADGKGYIKMPNVNRVAEMVNTLSALHSYQANVEVINSARSMMMKTLAMGQ